jgi:N-methylhydantoinase A
MKFVSADIGGTFTDMVFWDEENNLMKVLKVHSTPKNQSIGMMEGMSQLKVDLPEIAAVVHGTTAATNSIVERNGAVCGLLTTKGFRDILELRRRTRPHLYGLDGDFSPLIFRDMRLEVDERTYSDGMVLKEVNEKEVEVLAKQLIKKGAEAVVVCFVHSYVNPSNEKIAEKVLKKVWPNNFIVLSSDVLPEWREFERCSTAAANAYVQPFIYRYLYSLLETLKDKGYKSDVLMVQSNGGLVGSVVTLRYPINTFLSGPAAGVIAASYIGKIAGFDKIVSCDMGGTSFDISLIRNGQPIYATEKAIDFGIATRIPAIDITTIGAGGGSIAWIDGGGMLQVGPQSAGAEPGPVCYKKGGGDPTVTDANLVLGRIGKTLPLGADGRYELDTKAARTAIQKKIGDPLGLDVFQAADAMIKVVNTNMAGAIRNVSISRGYDPTEFVLVAFGGAGPMHANSLMKEVGLLKTVIPYHPGVASAIGCLITDFRRDFVQTVNKLLDDLELAEFNRIWVDQMERGRNDLIASRVSFTRVDTIFEAEVCYDGQLHVISVAFTSLPSSKEEIVEQFNKAYAKRFFETLPGVKIRVANLRCTVFGRRPEIDLKVGIPKETFSLKEAIKEVRPVYFEGTFMDCTVYDRVKIRAGETILGPAIVEERSSTTVVEPGTRIRVDSYHNLIMEEV